MKAFGSITFGMPIFIRSNEDCWFVQDLFVLLLTHIALVRSLPQVLQDTAIQPDLLTPTIPASCGTTDGCSDYTCATTEGSPYVLSSTYGGTSECDAACNCDEIGLWLGSRVLDHKSCKWPSSLDARLISGQYIIHDTAFTGSSQPYMRIGTMEAPALLLNVRSWK